MHTAKLTEVAELNPPLVGPVNEGEKVSFIPMSAVDAASVSAVDRETRLYSEVSKGYTPFLDGDVLVAKITPCFENGKIVHAHLTRRYGFGSTEFHVVRPHTDLADARYLAHFLRLDRVRREGESRMTGSAGQRRVPEHFLAGLSVPLPPLSEQQRIAEILDKADALRAKRRMALAQLDTLTQSIFLDMFGDPVTNPKRWAREAIAEIAEQVTDGEHLTPRRTREGIKLLSARNIRDGYLDFVNVDYIDADEYERISRRCDPVAGDVLISCSGTIGRVASVETTEKFSLVRSAALVRPNRDRIAHKFLEHYLRTPAMKARMLLRANASSQANLFQGQIREFPVYLPPLRLQIEFADRAASIGRLRNHERGSLSEIDALFASLQHRAFRGDL